MTTALMLTVSFSIPWVYGASPIFVKIYTFWVPANLNLTLLRLFVGSNLASTAMFLNVFHETLPYLTDSGF